jgi:hypothetical protein
MGATACFAEWALWNDNIEARWTGCPSSYFHDLATWSSINSMYDQKVITQVRRVKAIFLEL